MKRLILLSLAFALFGASTANAANITLLNVSYDPTRELYKSVNAAFAKDLNEVARTLVTEFAAKSAELTAEVARTYADQPGDITMVIDRPTFERMQLSVLSQLQIGVR